MSADFPGKKYITYSSSFTLPVTHSCANRCLYCGFRKIDDGLMGLDEIEDWLNRAKERKCSEVLIISGEGVRSIPSMQDQVRHLGFQNFPRYIEAVCQRILNHGLLPHTNIGSMELEEMAILGKVNASMGLMLENSDPLWGEKVHPQKNIENRMETIRNAGRLKIPFTTGILVGLGESGKSRFESLKWIADVNREFGHIQEIILQNYVPNPQSALAGSPLLPGDWEDLISFCKRRMPEVRVQIPPNLNSLWMQLVSYGANDLGGISGEKDFVNPNSPWEEIAVYEKSLQTRGVSLIPRLPIYREFYKKGWFSDRVGAVLSEWVNRHEFQYYLR